MAGTFPPDYFAPDYFTPEYFGGEVDANAISTAITGTATVTADLTAFSSSISASITGSGELLATISVTSAVVEDDDSGYWARVVKDRRKKKLKAQKPVSGVLAARIIGRSRLVALGEAPRVCWPCDIAADIMGLSMVIGSIDGPDRIAEQDEQDLQDLTDILMLLAA
jgi:hypothetical protein